MRQKVAGPQGIDVPSDASCVHVVAGVIRDLRGRVLLARRTEGRDLAGLWEFPGGKREPGETPEQALARELQEELGIDAQVGAELIRVPQQYPGKRLVLDVREVGTWGGSPRGREGQALVWVPPAKLASYAMPPADRPVVAALMDPPVYAITADADDAATWLEGVAAMLAAGMRRIQLRSHLLASGDGREAAGRAAELCRANAADVLINQDIALADVLGTGIHLRAAQLRSLNARPLDRDRLVAASCHDEAELRAAQALGCDFAVLGPVAPTRSHPDTPPIGWSGFARLRESVSLPIYALGGMSITEVSMARAHGGQGVAGISAFQGTTDG